MSSRFPPSNLRRYPSTCIICGGRVVEESVTLTLPDKSGGTRLVRGVPVGVCAQCGEQYLKADVADALDHILEKPPIRHEQVPVWEFAASA